MNCVDELSLCVLVTILETVEQSCNLLRFVHVKNWENVLAQYTSVTWGLVRVSKGVNWRLAR